MVLLRGQPTKHFFYIRITCFVTIFAMYLSGCSPKVDPESHLVRVGSGSISVAQFQQAVEAAYPTELEIEKGALDDLRMRVCNQVIEEMLILEKAKALGIQLTATEVDQAVAAIKADYPDNTFEETLLGNAVSFETWKQKLVRRLLIEKVIEQELVGNVQISSQDVAAYIKKHYPAGVPEEDKPDVFNQKVVRHLRQQKAEQAYQPWIDGLRQQFPVEIDREQWRLLEEAS